MDTKIFLISFFVYVVTTMYVSVISRSRDTRYGQWILALYEFASVAWWLSFIVSIVTFVMLVVKMKVQ